jgi:hypothetical protein
MLGREMVQVLKYPAKHHILEHLKVMYQASRPVPRGQSPWAPPTLQQPSTPRNTLTPANLHHSMPRAAD